jgi:hypothetical protein
VTMHGRPTRDEDRVIDGVAPAGKVLEGSWPATDFAPATELAALRAENERLRTRHAERDEAERVHLSTYRGACERRETVEAERDALRELVAALDAYAATDGLPWAERIEARKRVDEARAAVAWTRRGR